MAHHSEFLDQAMIFITKKAILVYALVLLICWFLGNHKFKKHVFFSGVTGIVALIVNLPLRCFIMKSGRLWRTKSTHSSRTQQTLPSQVTIQQVHWLFH